MMPIRSFCVAWAAASAPGVITSMTGTGTSWRTASKAVALAVLQANAVETGAGVLLNLGSGSILLSGLQLWQIEWNSDFVFAA